MHCLHFQGLEKTLSRNVVRPSADRPQINFPVDPLTRANSLVFTFPIDPHGYERNNLLGHREGKK